MDFKERIKDFVNIYKVSLIIGGVLLFLILLGNVTVYYLLIKDDSSYDYALENNISHVEEKKESKEEKVDIFYKVDIKGAVKQSGVYELKSNARVIDVINLAGGLLENADTSVTNLSKYIKDEMVIVIYTKEEVANFNVVIKEEEEEESKCIIYNEIIQNDSCKENIINPSEEDLEKDKDDNTNVEVDTKISINTADIELLMTIPGIGESKAKSIIEYREQEGLFNIIEDSRNVSGIGEKLFESIKDYITI